MLVRLESPPAALYPVSISPITSVNYEIMSIYTSYYTMTLALVFQLRKSQSEAPAAFTRQAGGVNKATNGAFDCAEGGLHICTRSGWFVSHAYILLLRLPCLHCYIWLISAESGALCDPSVFDLWVNCLVIYKHSTTICGPLLLETKDGVLVSSFQVTPDSTLHYKIDVFLGRIQWKNLLANQQFNEPPRDLSVPNWRWRVTL